MDLEELRDKYSDDSYKELTVSDDTCRYCLEWSACPCGCGWGICDDLGEWTQEGEHCECD